MQKIETDKASLISKIEAVNTNQDEKIKVVDDAVQTIDRSLNVSKLDLANFRIEVKEEIDSSMQAVAM